MAESKHIPKINTAGMINLWFDYHYLLQFAGEAMPESQVMFEIAMGELQQIIALFLESSPERGIREILDDDLYRKKYFKLNMRKLILIIDKFRDDKIIVDSKQQ